MKRAIRFVAAAAAVLALAGLARGWWVIGHGTIAEAADAGLPDDTPAFFREAGKQLSHLAGDPDRWKNPKAPHLRGRKPRPLHRPGKLPGQRPPRRPLEGHRPAHRTQAGPGKGGNAALRHPGELRAPLLCVPRLPRHAGRPGRAGQVRRLRRRAVPLHRRPGHAAAHHARLRRPPRRRRQARTEAAFTPRSTPSRSATA